MSFPAQETSPPPPQTPQHTHRKFSESQRAKESKSYRLWQQCLPCAFFFILICSQWAGGQRAKLCSVPGRGAERQGPFLRFHTQSQAALTHTHTYSCLCLRVSEGHIKGAYLKKLSDTNLSVRAKDQIFFLDFPKYFCFISKGKRSDTEYS